MAPLGKKKKNDAVEAESEEKVSKPKDGKKRKAIAQDDAREGKKRKGAAKVESAESSGEEDAGGDAETGSKKDKWLSTKQKKRKEVTALYADLINPGREENASPIVGEILDLIGKRATPMHQYCSAEVGSRVVQACLKWGSNAQRRQLLIALKDHLAKMATDRYGHVVVLKLLRYCARTATSRKPSAEEKKAQTQNVRDFMEAFRGKDLMRAFYHRYGCRVINGIYFSDNINSKEKRHLFHEVAIPKSITITKPELCGQRTLRQLLAAEDVPKEDQNAMLKHLAEGVDKAVDKELLGVDIVHLLFQAYCERATEKQLKELGDKCLAGSPHLLSSKPGAESLLYLLGVANAKQRKAFCKDVKGKFMALATNAVDYIVMMRLAITVDDTVLLSKTMFQEWSADLSALVFDKYGHKVLGYMLNPEDTKHWTPHERMCLALPAPTSLKAQDTRRQELVRMVRAPIGKVLQESPLKAAADIHAKNLLITYLGSNWDAEVLEALFVAGEAEAAGGDADLGLLGNGTTVTTLLVLLKLEQEGSETGLAGPLWKRCLQPVLSRAAVGRLSFVLLALLKQGGPTGTAVRLALKERRKEIQSAIKSSEAAGGNTGGAQKLLAAVDEAVAGLKKGSKA